MSDTTEATQPAPAPSQTIYSDASPSPSPDLDMNEFVKVKEVVFWKRKLMSLAVLGTATALWVAMEVYQFNFITLASWTAIFLISCSFLWANLLKLIRKEEQEASARLQVTEDTAVAMANSIRRLAENAIRWLFRVSAQREWYVSVGTVAVLYLLSIVGRSLDLLTFLYIGTVGGMTVPVIWKKYDHKIREYRERLHMQCKRFLSVIDQKVVQKIKNKVGGTRSTSTEDKEKMKKAE